MNKKVFAEVVSLVFHPVIFALFIPFLFIYRKTKNPFYSLEWVAFSCFFLLFGILLLYLVRPNEFFSDFDISKREKRVIFYSISCFIAVLYFAVAVIFKGIFFPLSIISLGIILGLVTLEIVNFYLKVSLHASVITAFVITVGLLYGIKIFLWIIVLVPLICWSRFFLKKHTLRELIAGIIVGSFTTLITFIIGKLLV